MKKITLFILFKFAEISAAIIVYLALSRFGFFIETLMEDEHSLESWYHFLYFLIGFVSILAPVMVVFLMFMLIVKGIPAWIESNWDWADKILNK